MILVETPDANKPVYAAWKCPLCFTKTVTLADTPMNGIPVRIFHNMLLFFVNGINNRTIEWLTGSKLGESTVYPHLFKKAASYYFRKKVQPYLVLPGIVEMDETYLGGTKYN